MELYPLDGMQLDCSALLRSETCHSSRVDISAMSALHGACACRLETVCLVSITREWREKKKM